MEPDKLVSPWGTSIRRTSSQRRKDKHQSGSVRVSGNRSSLSHDPGQQPKNSSPINCRSSAIHVAAVMSKFNETKRDLVKQTGLGGLLELKQMNKVNRRVSLWLLSKIGWEDGIIDIHDNLRMKFVSEDIEKIIATPATGRDVLATSLKQEDKEKFWEEHLSFLGPEESMLQKADAMVQEDLPANMTSRDADQFKIAFVIFIMGRFLATTKDFYVGNWNFWHALAIPEEISSYNWSAYVLSCLLESARKLLFANLMETASPAITGCPLLLQVIQHIQAALSTSITFNLVPLI